MSIRPQWGSAIKAFLAAGILASLVSPAQAEECRAGRSGPAGEPQLSAIVVDLASGTRLDPATLPEGTSGIVCRRPSIIPRPDDVRVLIEWSVAFGLTEDGQRALWIWARDGRLQITVDHGPLSVAERAAVNDWLEAAQARFAAALAPR